MTDILFAWKKNRLEHKKSLCCRISEALGASEPMILLCCFHEIRNANKFLEKFTTFSHKKSTSENICWQRGAVMIPDFVQMRTSGMSRECTQLLAGGTVDDRSEMGQRYNAVEARGEVVARSQANVRLHTKNLDIYFHGKKHA